MAWIRGCRRFVTRRRALAFVATLAVLLRLPAIGGPLMTDDYVQSAMVAGTFPVPKGPLDLYDWVGDATRATLVERGVFPWWTHPRLTSRFLRPLSSALLWADYRAFGRWPLPAHLHSFAWWLLACVAVHRLIRRALGDRIALVGAAIYALAPCHASPLAWLANREVLVSTALGALALDAYARWRDEVRARDAWWSSALFSLALLGGEYALCFGGYVIAIELVRRGERARKRLVRALPFALPAAVYLTARTLLGYGVYGSGFYQDPFRQPGLFFASAPHRLETLLADAWLTTDDAFWNGAAGWLFAVVALAVFPLLIVAVSHALGALSPGERRAAAWLLFGSCLSLAPLLSVKATVRLIAPAMIGVCAILAVVIDRGVSLASGARHAGAQPIGRPAALTAFAATVLAFAHLARSPALGWSSVREWRDLETITEWRMAWVRERVRDAPSKRVVIVRAQWGQPLLGGLFMLDPDRGVPPAAWWVLTHGFERSRMLRTGPRAIDLVATTPRPLVRRGEENPFRSDDAPLHAGDVVSIEGMRVTVLEADGGGLRRLRFEFDRDLDDPSFVWLAEATGGYCEERPPAIGDERLLPP